MKHLSVTYKDNLYPPTSKEIAQFCELLQAGAFVETAAAVAVGWDIKHLRQALKRGRRGEMGFRDFVAAMNSITHTQSLQIWNLIMERVAEGDFGAIKYVHSTRIAPRERMVQEALLSDELEPDTEEASYSQEDLAAAEARVIAALDANNPPKEH